MLPALSGAYIDLCSALGKFDEKSRNCIVALRYRLEKLIILLSSTNVRTLITRCTHAKHEGILFCGAAKIT